MAFQMDAFQPDTRELLARMKRFEDNFVERTGTEQEAVENLLVRWNQSKLPLPACDFPSVARQHSSIARVHHP
jgi:hypothetical protein